MSRYSQHDDRAYRKYDSWENEGDKRKRDYNNSRPYSNQYNSGSSRNYYENSRDTYNDDDYKRRKYYESRDANVEPSSSSSHRSEHSDYNNRSYSNSHYDNSYHYNRNYGYDSYSNYEDEYKDKIVYISTLPSNATEQDIKDLLTNNNLTNYFEVSMKNQPKGCAYVIFNDITSVTPALALSGSYVKGFPITIKQAEEKKRNKRDYNDHNEKYSNDNYYQGQTKVYAGNVPTIFNRSDLVQLFGAFGYIGKIDMKKDDTENFNGIAIITFQRFEGARKAVSKLNGLSLSSKYPNLKVGFYSENEAEKKTDNQDDYEEEKPNYNNYSQKPSSNIYAERFNSLISTDVRGSLSQNISVSHMFEPSIDQLKVVEDSIRKACKSFGNILHIFLDNQDPNGMVYIRFDNTIGSQNAAQRLPSLREEKVTPQSSSSKGSASKGLNSYFKQGAHSTDISPFSSDDGATEQNNNLASFLEDDSNLDPNVQKSKIDMSTIDESLFSFISNPANFDEQQLDDEDNHQEEETNINIRESLIAQGQSPIVQQSCVSKNGSIKSSHSNSEMIESFLTTCENLSQFLEGDSLGSIEDFFVGSCYDISKLSLDEIIKIFQESYGTGNFESKRRFSNFVSTKVMPFLDEIIHNNENFLEETIKKEIQKENFNSQKLLYLFMVFCGLQGQSIKSHKTQIEMLKGEGLSISAKQLGEHAKKIKEFIGTIQTKDQIIEKLSKDNVSILVLAKLNSIQKVHLLSELNFSCQENEGLLKKVKNLKLKKKHALDCLHDKANDLENLRRELSSTKTELLENVEKISLQYQSELKQAMMMISLKENQITETKQTNNFAVEEYREELKKLEMMVCKKEKQIESHVEREISLKNTMREMHLKYTEALSKINELSKLSKELPTITQTPNSPVVNNEIMDAIKEMKAVKEHFSSLLEKAVAVHQSVDTQAYINKKEMDELKRKLEMYQIELTLDPEGTREESKELKSKVEILSKQKEMLCEEIKSLNQELAVLRVISQERSFEKQRFETKLTELLETQQVREEKYKKLKKQLFKLKNKEYHYVKEQSSLELKAAKLIDQNQELFLKIKSLEHNNLMAEGKRIRLSVDLAGTSKEHELLVQQHSKAIARLSTDQGDKLKKEKEELEQLVIKLKDENESLRKSILQQNSQLLQIVQNEESIKRTISSPTLVTSVVEPEPLPSSPTSIVEPEEGKKGDISFKVIPVKRKPLQQANSQNILQNVPQQQATIGVKITKKLPTILQPEGKENIVNLR